MVLTSFGRNCVGRQNLKHERIPKETQGTFKLADINKPHSYADYLFLSDYPAKYLITKTERTEVSLGSFWYSVFINKFLDYINVFVGNENLLSF